MVSPTNNSTESQSCDVWGGSRVTSEGVLSEKYIGKYDFCHSDCHFLLHFWSKLSKNNNFDVKTVRKIPNIDGEIKYLVFVTYHLDSQSQEWVTKY